MMSKDLYQFESDPYGYWNNAEDSKRLSAIQGHLKNLDPDETADVGCGEGFITEHLPGKAVFALDPSVDALDTFKSRIVSTLPKEQSRFHFLPWNVFDAPPYPSRFDLVVVTGLLYPHLLGAAGHLACRNIVSLLKGGGTLISVHIEEWNPFEPALERVDLEMYSYRDKIHRLEVYKRL